MGAANVAKVFAHWTERLTHREVVALAYMGLISLDADSPSVYWGGWEAIASALGLDPKANPSSSRRQTTKVLGAIRDSGALVSSGAAKKGVRAEYALALDPDTTWEPNVDGRKVKWAPQPRPDLGPKRSHVPTEGRDQNGPTNLRPKRSHGRDQNGPKVGTRTVPPMSTEEQPEENGEEYESSPQAARSPAEVAGSANDGSENLTEEENRTRQLAALEALMTKAVS